MTARRDYYQVLGVPRDADEATIKNAFRRLARRYHPDTSTEPDGQERFREIAEAYGVLSDPAKRASYAAQGSAGLAGATAEDLWGGIDFADIFGPGAPTFGNLFERLFWRPAAAPPRGEDLRADLVVSLEQVLAGGNQVVTIGRLGPFQEDTVTIRIPPGIREGTTLRLAGRGSPSSVPGAPPGDAYVTIRTRTDPRFTQVGADLWYNLHIQVPDAALGTTAIVPALDGQAQVRVPPGTQPGTVLRIDGRGLPRYPGHGRGSLNVTVIVDIPRQLSPWQRLLYEQLRADAVINGEVSREAHRSGGRLRALLGHRREQPPRDPGDPATSPPPERATRRP